MSLRALGVAIAIAVLTAPLALAQPQGPQADTAAGDAAFQGEDYAGAVAAYRRALAAGLNHSLLHFRLGYSLHVTGHHEEALTHHRAAAHITHPALRIDALYNAACASALLGRPDEAIGWLERAVDAGFRDLAQVGKDTDLDSIRNDARFKAIVEGIGKAPRLSEWMDFFVGDWSCVEPDGGAEILTLKVERPLEGSHTLVSTSVQSPRTGQPAATPHWAGALYPDAQSRTWTWTYADGIGTRMEFKGERAGKGMRFTGRQRSAAGEGAHVRLTLTPQDDGSVTETAEVSEDGAAWRTHHESRYVKRGQAPGR